MSKISKSPERHTFQAEGYIKRCEEDGKEPREDYLNLYKSARQQDECDKKVITLIGIVVVFETTLDTIRK
jgi:hypothetical protein